MKTIIANPPFSASWSADTAQLSDPRFKEYGKLAPKSKADYAFIQDMIHKLDSDGVMTAVLPHGVLFRGSSEGHIRKYLIEKMNCLDAVIGLPPNIFSGTQIPTCVLVFKKNREPENDIVFIDASREFEKAKNKNLLLETHIEKITSTYMNRIEIEKYSHLATLQEIKDNDYNLNIPRYVDIFEDEEPINIYAVTKELNDLELKKRQLNSEINEYLKELGLPLITN